MNELKPCPICGKELYIHGPEDWTPTFYDPDSGGDPYSADCDCGFSFCNNSYDYKEFVTALNCRPEPANAPLTLDDLRGTRGNPIYVVRLHYGVLDENDIRASGWFLVEPQMVHRRSGTYSENYYWDEYGKTWLAYRRKPEQPEQPAQPVPPAYSHIVQRFNKKE